MATKADVLGSAFTFVYILIGFTAGLPTYYLTDYCGTDFTQEDHSIIVELSSNGSYPPMTNCSVRGVAPTGKRMMVKFLNISSSPNCGSYAYLYEYQDTGAIEVTPNICTVPSDVLTSGSAAYLGFYSDTGGADVYLRVLITIFWTGNCDEFRCEIDRCIDSGLECSGYDNCGDDSNNDLDSCKPFNYRLLVIWLSIGFVVCATIIAFLNRQKIKLRWAHFRSKHTSFTKPTSSPHLPKSGRDASSFEPVDYVPHRQPEVPKTLPPLWTRRVSFTLPGDHDDLRTVALKHVSAEHELNTAVSLPDFIDAGPSTYFHVPESPPPPYSDINMYATSRPGSGNDRSTSPAPPPNVLYVSVVSSDVAPEPSLPEHHNTSSCSKHRRHSHCTSVLPSVDR